MGLLSTDMLEVDDHPLATAEARMATVTDEEFFAALGVVDLRDARGLRQPYGDDVVDERPEEARRATRPAARRGTAGYITRANIDQMNALVACLRRDGVTVLFQVNWSTVSAGGSFGPFVGGVVHHDASSLRSGTWGSIGVIVNGRQDLEGPLSQIQIARGPVPQLTVITAGRGNHAGFGGPYKTVPKDSGNRWLIGAEVANDGLGEPYSEATLYAIESFGHGVLEAAA